jgi:flagellar hook-basal body complex protein FliE
MNINAIHSSILMLPAKTSEATNRPATAFAQWVGDHLAQTNQKLNEADQALTDLAMGRADNLHQTMLCLEEAKMSFQYLEQIRNRLMTAYQDLLREQI